MRKNQGQAVQGVGLDLGSSRSDFSAFSFFRLGRVRANELKGEDKNLLAPVLAEKEDRVVAAVSGAGWSRPS